VLLYSNFVIGTPFSYERREVETVILKLCACYSFLVRTEFLVTWNRKLQCIRHGRGSACL